MINRFRAFGVAAVLIAGPATIAMAMPGATPGTDSTTPHAYHEPSAGSHVQTPGTTQQERAENSVQQRNAWSASHKRKADTGSYPTHSGIAGGGGPGGK